MMQKQILLGLITVAGCSQFAYGQLIDVDFKASNFPQPNYSGGAVLGGAGDQWNNAYAGNTDPNPTTYGPQALFDSLGNATSAMLSFTCVGAVTPLSGPIQPAPEMTNDYLYDNTGGSILVTITGLAASQAYDLVLYVASNDGANGARALTGTANGVAFAATGNALPAF